ncbi:hypothetical protein ACFSGX_14200 [Sphingomonas arantia]|uniref:Uncharacterized protein n=1 Tax=Sphingomonas arantia TaxID=1460676 RepID=A0ABW4U0U7_9SPHN
MEAPRYRRWFGFSYLPLNRSGFLMIVAFLAVEVAIMLMGELADPIRFTFELVTLISFAVFFWFWSFVHTRTE